jgi:uncharacterized integral membrane protein
MSSKTLPLVFLAIATLIVLALAFVNGTAVTLNLFGAAVSIPEGALLAGGYLIGVALTVPMLFVRAASAAASQQRLNEWQQQDAKLSVQVQSDREKQLEAKIATLETALQKALKR